MTHFEGFNHEYAKYFQTDFPARATVACELKAGALVEVSVVAYKEYAPYASISYKYLADAKYQQGHNHGGIVEEVYAAALR